MPHHERFVETMDTFEPNEALWCNHREPHQTDGNYYICTRTVGHSGSHVGHSGPNEALGWWENEDAPPDIVAAAMTPVPTTRGCTCTDAGCDVHPTTTCRYLTVKATITHGGITLHVCEDCLRVYLATGGWDIVDSLPTAEVIQPTEFAPLNQCRDESPRRYVCTLARGHRGEHVAHLNQGRDVVDRWGSPLPRHSASTDQAILQPRVPDILPPQARQTCQHCGTTFYAIDSDADDPENFCSERCQNNWDEDHYTAEDPDPDEEVAN